MMSPECAASLVHDANELVRLTLSPNWAGPLDSPTVHPAAQLIAKTEGADLPLRDRRDRA